MVNSSGRIDYTFANLTHDVGVLVSQILRSGEKFDGIVALGRGGLIPGVALSHALKVPLYPIIFGKTVEDRIVPAEATLALVEQNRFLIVDDMIDTGEVLGELFSYWNLCNLQIHNKDLDLSRFSVAVLLNNTDVNVIYSNGTGQIRAKYAGTKFSRAVNPQWITYFWEDMARRTPNPYVGATLLSNPTY